MSNKRSYSTTLSKAQRKRPDIAAALEAGWEFHCVTGTRHLMFRYPPTGRTTTVPLTPSDHRATKNGASQFRRLTAEENARLEAHLAERQD